MTREFGFAKDAHGPFAREVDAVQDAMNNGPERFITGFPDASDDPLRVGWYWASEDDYIQAGGNKMKAVNLP